MLDEHALPDAHIRPGSDGAARRKYRPYRGDFVFFHRNRLLARADNRSDPRRLQHPQSLAQSKAAEHITRKQHRVGFPHAIRPALARTVNRQVSLQALIAQATRGRVLMIRPGRESKPPWSAAKGHEGRAIATYIPIGGLGSETNRGG